MNVGVTVKAFLESEGFDVEWITRLDPRMPDEEILRRAYRGNRVLITIDKDFGDLIFNKKLPHKGVIRLEDAKPHVLGEIPEGITERLFRIDQGQHYRGAA